MMEEDDIHVVDGKFTFSEDAKKVVHTTYKKTKPKLADMEGSLPPVDWDTRSKPEISNVWDEETAEELAKYIEWHGRHPHCVTPRKLNDNTKHVVAKKIFDEELPGTFYTENGIKMKPLKKEFLPTKLGADGETDEVSFLALRTEYNSYIQNGYEDDDPWFIMSVKDQLEQSHMDGSHTTVKSKPAKKKSELSEFQQEMEWQKVQYGGYTGGAPNLSSYHLAMIDRLALADKSLLGQPKVKVSPWQETHVYSKFTAKGTALDGFTKKDLEDRIRVAVALHHNPYINDRSRIDDSTTNGSRGSSRQSSRPSSRIGSLRRTLSRQQSKLSNPGSPTSSRPSSKISRKKKSKKIEVVPVRDQYDVMQEKIGGLQKIKKIENSLIKLSKQITKKSKQTKALVDTSMSLIEACDKLRVLKVTTLLLAGQGKADMLTPDDETLFLRCFQKAIKLDNITSSLKVGDEKEDSSDRKKLQKILDLLIKYGAKINSMKSKDSLAAVHIAAINDNAKLMSWLIQNEAKLTLLTISSELLTPLMLAAKYGYINIVVCIVQSGFDVNHCNNDGRTALHIAAMFGQTRMAIFLLRIGANKTLQDKDGKIPADLAIKLNYYSTAQAIAAFTLDMNRYRAQMEYMTHQYAENHSRPHTVMSRVTTASSAISEFLNDVDASSLLSKKTWVRTYRRTKEKLRKKWNKLKLKIRLNPFKSKEEYEEEEEEQEEADVDLDQIEEIARQQLMAQNPELAEHKQSQDDFQGSLDGSNDNYDDQSLDSLQDGDQIYPMDG